MEIFNLGTQPVDDTSLIGQNLSNQDLVNKRLRQMDKNIDDMNGGVIVSLERSGMTKEYGHWFCFIGNSIFSVFLVQ